MREEELYELPPTIEEEYLRDQRSDDLREAKIEEELHG
jgi:hypothetical protein